MTIPAHVEASTPMVMRGRMAIGRDKRDQGTVVAGGQLAMHARNDDWQLASIAITVGFVRQLSRHPSRHSNAATWAASTHSLHTVSDAGHGAPHACFAACRVALHWSVPPLQFASVPP